MVKSRSLRGPDGPEPDGLEIVSGCNLWLSPVTVATGGRLYVAGRPDGQSLQRLGVDRRT